MSFIKSNARFSVVNRDHCTAFMESLMQYFIHEDNLDLVFICDKNIVVKAHKMVIATVSRFLKDLIVSEKDIVHISLPGIDDRKLRLLIHFLYEGVSKISKEELIAVKEVMTVLDIRLPDTEIKSFRNFVNGPALAISKNNFTQPDNVFRKGKDFTRSMLEQVPRNLSYERNADVPELQNECEDPLTLMPPLMVPGNLTYVETGSIIRCSSPCSLIRVKEEMVDLSNEFTGSAENNELVNNVNDSEMVDDIPGFRDNTRGVNSPGENEIEDPAVPDEEMTASGRQINNLITKDQVTEAVLPADSMLHESEYEEFSESSDHELNDPPPVPHSEMSSLLSSIPHIKKKQIDNGNNVCKVFANIFCKTCKKRFISKRSLQSHNCWKYYRFRCKYCDASFKDKHKCDAHLRVHLGIKPYKCTICDRSFCQKFNLQTHCKQVHKVSASSTSLSVFTEEQKICLESVYETDKYPEKKSQERLAQELGVQEKMIYNWFLDKRQRDNLSTTEDIIFTRQTVNENSEANNSLMSYEAADENIKNIVTSVPDTSGDFKLPGVSSPLLKSEDTLKNKCLIKRSGVCKIYPNISCKTCKKKFIHKRSLKSHDCWTYRPYKCIYCDASFDSENKCKEHIRVHTDPKQAICTLCNKFLNTKVSLDSHKEVCKGMSSLSSPAPHIKKKQIVNRNNACKVVANIFCMTCRKRFISTRSLKAHNCTKYYRFRCDYCDASFKDKHRCDAHIRLHMGIKPYKCTLCDGSFCIKNHLNRHYMKVHKAKPEDINFTTQTVNENSEVNSLMSNETADENVKNIVTSVPGISGDFKLSDINKEKNTKKQTRVIRLFTEEDIKILEQTYKKKRLPDSYCIQELSSQLKKPQASVYNWFKTKRKKDRKSSVLSLKTYSHGTTAQKEIENGRRKISKYKNMLECCTCKKKFLTNSSLRVHSCTNYKKYKCRFCDASFQASNLCRIHMRLHTGEKPYKCHLCAEKFCQKGNLKTHLKIHHGDQNLNCTM